MQTPSLFALERPLPDSLTLRLARDDDDLQAVMEAHAAAFGEEDRSVIEAKLFQRPGRRPEQVILVEDKAAGRVASSVSLVEQTWCYEGIPLHVGEVGIVSTRPEYRHRGLVRAQFDVYHRLARRAGCLLSVISGIPYFYRQYGYEYIIATGGGARLFCEQIPPLTEGQPSPYQVRRATPEDWPQVLAFYQSAVQGACLSAVIDEPIWDYQHRLPEACGDRKETYLVEREGQPCGFVRVNANEHGWDKGVVISAAHLPAQAMCLAALQFARGLAEGRQEHTVTVSLPLPMPLLQLARDLGGEPRRGYAWQIRVLDPALLLLTIAPALERRLAQSPFAGLDDTVRLNLYRETLSLHFRSGRLLSVASRRDGDPNGGGDHDDERADMSCPPQVAPMCWLGQRSVQELVDWYPDAYCRSGQRLRLLDTLFPKRPSLVLSLL